jgi:hypothetical protein
MKGVCVRNEQCWRLARNVGDAHLKCPISQTRNVLLAAVCWNFFKNRNIQIKGSAHNRLHAAESTHECILLSRKAILCILHLLEHSIEIHRVNKLTRQGGSKKDSSL